MKTKKNEFKLLAIIALAIVIQFTSCRPETYSPLSSSSKIRKSSIDTSNNYFGYFGVYSISWTNGSNNLELKSSKFPNNVYATKDSVSSTDFNISVWSNVYDTCYLYKYKDSVLYKYTALNKAQLVSETYLKSEVIEGDNVDRNYRASDASLDKLGEEIAYIIVKPGPKPVTPENPVDGILWVQKFKCEKGESSEDCKKRAIEYLCRTFPERCYTLTSVRYNWLTGSVLMRGNDSY